MKNSFYYSLLLSASIAFSATTAQAKTYEIPKWCPKPGATFTMKLSEEKRNYDARSLFFNLSGNPSAIVFVVTTPLQPNGYVVRSLPDSASIYTKIYARRDIKQVFARMVGSIQSYCPLSIIKADDRIL